MKHPPQSGLPPASGNWRRWVEDGIRGLHRRLNTLTSTVTSNQKTTLGALRVIGTQLQRVREQTDLITLSVVNGVIQESPVHVAGPSWASLAVVTASVGSETVNVTEPDRAIVITAGSSNTYDNNPSILDLVTFSNQPHTWKDYFPSTVLGNEVWVSQSGEPTPPAGYDATFNVLIQWF